jgi:hypothetical protein
VSADLASANRTLDFPLQFQYSCAGNQAQLKRVKDAMLPDFRIII